MTRRALQRLPLLRRVFCVGRQFVTAAGPTRARPGKDARLRLDRSFAVQRAGWNHDNVAILYLTRQATAAGGAEIIGEPLGLRHLERADLLFTTEPPEHRRLEKEVRGVPSTCRLATARTMTMVEPLCLAGDLVLDGAAQATAIEGGLGHGPLRWMIESNRTLDNR